MQCILREVMRRDTRRSYSIETTWPSYRQGFSAVTDGNGRLMQPLPSDNQPQYTCSRIDATLVLHPVFFPPCFLSLPVPHCSLMAAICVFFSWLQARFSRLGLEWEVTFPSFLQLRPELSFAASACAGPHADNHLGRTPWVHAVELVQPWVPKPWGTRLF